MITKRIFILCCLVLATAVFAQQPPPRGRCCAPQPPGLVDWWQFNEPSGPAARDIAGAVDNVGTHTNVTPQPGVVDRAACYNGSTSVTIVRDQDEVDFLGDCADDRAESGTIDFWIRTSRQNGTITVLDKRESAANFLRGYSVYLWNGQVGFQMATGPGTNSCNTSGGACDNFTSPFQVADGQWHFVAITFTRCRGAAGMFYVDGVTSSFRPRVGDISNKSDLYIGRTVPTMSGTPLRGCIDELEFSKRALPALDLAAIYAAGSAGKCRDRR